MNVLYITKFYNKTNYLKNCNYTYMQDRVLDTIKDDEYAILLLFLFTSGS